MAWASRKYKHLLDDSRLTLRTDNEAVTWLSKVQDERAKLTRWAMYLGKFNLDIEYVLGKANELPDALSHFPRSEESYDEEDNYDALGPPRQRHTVGNVVVVHVVSRTIKDEVIQAQQSDPPDNVIRSKMGARLQEKQAE